MGAPLTVLLVEHDDADAELNIHTLESAGFDVHADVAGTAEDFRRFLAIREYDIVLADYRLPSWTGMDAFRDLRSLGHDTPLILVTGTIGDERAVDCVREGVADYVLKENIGRLGIAVHRALQEHASRRELARVSAQTREFQLQAQEREARFTQLADTIGEVFYLVEADYSRTLFVNRAYESIFGRSTESVYADPESFLRAVHPDDQLRMQEHISRVQRGEFPGHLDFRVVRPDGEIRWVMSCAVPILNERGEVYRISGVALDITDQRAAREALVETELRFRKLVDAAFDGIVITQRGVILEVNRGFVDMFRLQSERDAVGRHALDFVAPESRQAVGQRIGDGAETVYDLVALRPDGTTFLAEATARDHDVGGHPGRITALRDVTHQRTLEEQVRQAQKMEAVGRLAGGVAHDFNNLLSVISSYAEFIRADLAPDDPRATDAEEIIKASTAAASLTRQLLAFSRQEVIQPLTLAVQDLIVSVEKMLRRLIGEDIVLQTSLGNSPLMVRVDQGQFEQVIMNLAVNSRDAMPTGGKLSISAERVELVAGGDQLSLAPGAYAVISVSDTGIGMDERTKARIFEPFFTTKEHGKGTGLGLATVYGIVKQNGGSITVDSSPGQGSTFRVYLPAATATGPGSESPATQSEIPRGRETILIAEDSPGVRGAAQRILAQQGYIVFVAPNGHSAIDIATYQRPDLLLTDVVMPEMSGRELAERFTAICPGSKVLFMSGYTDDAVILHGVLSAEVAFLQKPFSPESLARRVREVLDRGRS